MFNIKLICYVFIFIFKFLFSIYKKFIKVSLFGGKFKLISL